jgi:hypothetical protein
LEFTFARSRTADRFGNADGWQEDVI